MEVITNGIITTLNTCGYAFKLSSERYSDRIDRTCAYIKVGKYDDFQGVPIIIGLQEFLVGRDMKFISQIHNNLPEYEIIMPVGYDPVNYKSVVNLLLIRKDILTSYKCEILPINESLYMYNYVVAKTKMGDFRLLNLHCVQTAQFTSRPQWYIKKRLDLSERLWSSIFQEVEKYHEEESFIIMGDMNEAKDGPNMVRLQFEYNMVNLTDNAVTYFNPEYGLEKKIDHIMISMPTIANKRIKVHSAHVDQDVYKNEKLTDHALVNTMITV